MDNKGPKEKKKRLESRDCADCALCCCDSLAKVKVSSYGPLEVEMRSSSRDYDALMLLNLSKTLWPLFLSPSCPLVSPVPGLWLRIPSSTSRWLYRRSNKELPTFPSARTQPPRGLEDAKASRLSLMIVMTSQKPSKS